jgi:hypothetical protein
MAIVSLQSKSIGMEAARSAVTIFYDDVLLQATAVQVTSGTKATYVKLPHPTNPLLDFSNTTPPNTTSAQIAVPTGFPMILKNGKRVPQGGIEMRIPA